MHHSRDPKGANTVGTVAAERLGPEAWQGAGPLGTGCGTERGHPGLLLTTPCGRPKIQEAYAKRIPSLSRD